MAVIISILTNNHINQNFNKKVLTIVSKKFKMTTYIIDKMVYIIVIIKLIKTKTKSKQIDEYNISIDLAWLYISKQPFNGFLLCAVFIFKKSIIRYIRNWILFVLLFSALWLEGKPAKNQQQTHYNVKISQTIPLLWLIPSPPSIPLLYL